MSALRPVSVAVAAAAIVAGCAAASHAGALQPPSPTALARADRTPAPRNVRMPGRQLGIDVDFYNYPGLNVAQGAKADVAYIKQLHGNAISISFPFFMNGPRASSVHGTAATPSPAELATVAQYAEHAGLYVSIRPLLDEKSLNYPGGRTHWTPRNQARWFASYENFLRPYAQMAQRAKIPEMFTGVEFNMFPNSRYWSKLAAYLRRYYHGTLAYATVPKLPTRRTESGVVQMLDAYKPMPLPDSASIAALTRSWDIYLGSGLHGIVISELGISAQHGAYAIPYATQWFGKPLVPVIQVRWFTAACNAAVRYHDGMYFWSIGIAQQFNVPPGQSDPASFVDSPGARAIGACFKRLG
jgi:hypothetical protein